MSQDPERLIRDAFVAGNLKLAATTLLHAYGPEILAFLKVRLRDDDVAGEAFATFAEDLWSGLPGFRWTCSARTWAYTVARHAASRTIKQARSYSARNVPLSSAGPLSELADRLYSETSLLIHRATLSRMALLRKQLPVDDQTLLLLRINRELPWEDIARILKEEAAPGSDLDPGALKSEAARLRKRFQLAKAKLRRLVSDADLSTGRIGAGEKNHE